MIRHLSKPRKKSHAIIGATFLTGFISLIVFVPPHNILVYSSFFFLLFLSLFYLLSFVLNHSRRALLLTIGVTFILLLRALDLRHWLYVVLAFAILISLEFLFRKK